MVSATSRRSFFGHLTALATCTMCAPTLADDSSDPSYEYQQALKTLRAKLTQIKRGHFTFSGEHSLTEQGRKRNGEVSGACYFDFPADRFRMDRTEPEWWVGGETVPVTERYLRIPGEEAVWNSRHKRIDFTRDGSKLDRSFEPFDFRCFGFYSGSSFRQGLGFERVLEGRAKLKPKELIARVDALQEYHFDVGTGFTVQTVLDPAMSSLPVENVVKNARGEVEVKSSVEWARQREVVVATSFQLQYRSFSGPFIEETSYRIALRWENINQPVLDFSFDRYDLSHQRGDYIGEWTAGKPRVVGIVGTNFRPKP